jgi:hypothetical protein
MHHASEIRGTLPIATPKEMVMENWKTDLVQEQMKLKNTAQMVREVEQKNPSIAGQIREIDALANRSKD